MNTYKDSLFLIKESSIRVFEFIHCAYLMNFKEIRFLNKLDLIFSNQRKRKREKQLLKFATGI